MARHASLPKRRERGFSLVEMLIVVVIIAIMAAVALPNIGGYIKNYRIKGAAQLVAGELQAARSRAIMTNTNLGVSFAVLDYQSYRFIQEDLEVEGAVERFGPLKRLPTGVIFVPNDVANAGPTLRFLRLGGFCNPATSSTTSCQAAVDPDKRIATGELIDTASADKKYIVPDATGTMEIRVREITTDLVRTVRVAPGGRVLPQP